MTVTLAAGTRLPHYDLGQCPDCGVVVSLCVDDEGEPLGMVHPTPTCPTFDHLDAASFYALLAGGEAS